MIQNIELPQVKRRRWVSFWAVVLMQSQNAFNDNFAKFILIPLASWLIYEGVLAGGAQHFLAVLLPLPYLILAPLSGWLADRFSKSRMIQISAWLQVLVLALLYVSFMQRSFPFALVAFFLLAVQSTILSPSKAGVVKELIGGERLTLGSGFVQGGSILAILAGQILAGFWFDRQLAQSAGGWEAVQPAIWIFMAGGALSLISAYTVERTEAQGAPAFKAKILTSHWKDLKGLLGNIDLRRSAIGVAFFWGFATFLNLLIIEIAERRFSGSLGTGSAVSVMMGYASIGIALGSILTGWVGRKRVELGIVPIGALVMLGSLLALMFVDPNGKVMRVLLACAGVGAAAFLVPLQALLMDRAKAEERGKVISASNMLNNTAGIIAVGMQFGMKSQGASIRFQFGFLVLLALLTSWITVRSLVKPMLRFVVLSLVSSVYKVRGFNLENIPEEGGVLLTPNHVTYMDALVLSVACPRPVRFIMIDHMFENRIVGTFCRFFDTVPISPVRAKEAIKIASAAVSEGSVVCIFPEGQLTRTGSMNKLQRGFEMIARRAKCPVLPVYIDGLWGSIFSFERGRYIRKFPYRIPYGLNVSFGETQDSKDLNADRLGVELRKISQVSFEHRKAHHHLGKAKRFLLSESTPWKDSDLSDDLVRKSWANAMQLRELNLFTKKETVWVNQAIPLEAQVTITIIARLLRWDLQWKESLDTAPKVAVIGFTEESLGRSYPVLELGDSVGQVSASSLPILIHEGIVIAVSLSHPFQKEREEFQAGWEEGAYGRLLPGFAAENTEQGLMVKGIALKEGECLLPHLELTAEGFVRPYKNEELEE